MYRVEPTNQIHAIWDKRLHLQRWLRFVLAGTALWGVSLVALQLTNDSYVVPTVVLIGCFVVPVGWVLRVTDRDKPSEVTTRLLIRLFLWGGVLGFLSSAVLETPIISMTPLFSRIGVGVIEEASKLAILAWMTRRFQPKSPAAGFVLGATVGFGFAAFESSGYALDALMSAGGNSIGALASTELARAIITPVTHGLWTAITGAILFQQSRRGRFRMTWPLVTVLAGVAGLHTLWDLMPNITLGIDLHLLGGHGSGRLLPQALPANATPAMKALNELLDDVGLVVLGAIGLLAAHRVRSRMFDCPRGLPSARRAHRRGDPARPLRVAGCSAAGASVCVALPPARHAPRRRPRGASMRDGPGAGRRLGAGPASAGDSRPEDVDGGQVSAG